MAARNNTWDKLPAAKREALASVDAAKVADLIEKKQWASFYELWEPLVQLAHDQFPLTDSMKDALIYPFQRWAVGALDKVKWAAIKGNVPYGASCEAQAAVVMDVSPEMVVELVKTNEFSILEQVVNVLHSIKDTHGWTEDQEDFVELAESVLNKYAC